ncbi:MAG: Crp/Fnr family transcriptional regulator [Myxococcota bacterium]
MPAKSDMVEMLLRSPLLADMEASVRQDLALRFETRPFTNGQTLLSTGADGRALLEILAGTAEVYLREDGHRYRVAQLEPGAITGEGAFFNGTAPRTADVVGTSEGIVAVLPWTAYQALALEGHLGALAIERAVLAQLGHRLKETNVRLRALLDNQKTGAFENTFKRLFNIPTAAPGVHDG